jgi:hypothetical protein
VQVSANYLCLLETVRLLLAAPHASQEALQAQVRMDVTYAINVTRCHCAHLT